MAVSSTPPSRLPQQASQLIATTRLLRPSQMLLQHMSPIPHPLSPVSAQSPAPRLSTFQLLLPTTTLYAAPSGSQQHYGPYAKERAELDWGYHQVPTRERQQLQDEIVRSCLKRVVPECERATDGRHGCSRKPLALFTAGGMGAGKGHTLRQFLRQGTIRLPQNFVWVDPDALARELPERPQYLAACPKQASTLLHPEASLLQEIVSGVAKTEKRSLVVDGSLTDCGWFKGVMRSYEQAGYDIEILFVFAGEETMLQRATRRAIETGRVTNPENIKKSRLKSPECVSRLAKREHVNRVRLVDNSEDHIPASIVYDSERDPLWRTSGRSVDVVGFVEGRLVQVENGRVCAKERRRAMI